MRPLVALNLQVDFSSFRAAVNKESRPSGLTTPKPTDMYRATEYSGPSTPYGVVGGYEFTKALEATLGAQNVTLPPELAKLPHVERVRKLAPQIHELFNKYDNGKGPHLPCPQHCQGGDTACMAVPRHSCCRRPFHGPIPRPPAGTRSGGNPRSIPAAATSARYLQCFVQGAAGGTHGC